MGATKEEKAKFNIIVVDDSEFSRKTMVRLLEEENYKVTGQASSAEDALKLNQVSPCQLFIVDVVMPNITGLELASLIKESFPQTLILLISSLASENIIIEGISAGANDFLKKPFSSTDFLAAVDKIYEFGKAERYF